MWYKTSEIRATLLVNLAPTRPIIPIAAALSSDKETADKQAWSLPATKTSVVNSRATRCDSGQHHVCTYVLLRKCMRARNCVHVGLLTGRTWPRMLIMLSRHLPASYPTVSRERSFIRP